MKWEYDDGGRAAAGFRGDTGDCVCRAIAIATGRPYRQVYNELNFLAEDERPRGKRRSHARLGVHKKTQRRYLDILAWRWIPTMGIGTGCQVHLIDEELPTIGTYIVALSRHMSAIVDGFIRDTYDPSRGGTRCVYGLWVPPGSDIDAIVYEEGCTRPALDESTIYLHGGPRAENDPDRGGCDPCAPAPVG